MFYRCLALSEIELTTFITEIGEEVFEGCVALKSITMPPSNAMFRHCKALEHLTILERSMTTELRNAIFCHCKYLPISEGSTDLPEYAFYGTSIKTLTILSSTIKIGDWSFSACDSIETVNIKSSSVQLGNGVFAGCANLSDVKMPKSITSFGVFVGCWKLSQQQLALFHHQQSSENRLGTGPGPNFEFGGETQKGWGPEYWGVTLQQIQKMKEHPDYNRESYDGKTNYLMREYVQSTIEPLAEGTGMGYALFMNQEKPLKRKLWSR